MYHGLQLHHHLKPTAVQRENLHDLARHLVLRSALLRRWNRLAFSDRAAERMPLATGAVVAGRKIPPMMPMAFGPLAGVPARVEEGWDSYLERAFAMPMHSPFEQWVQAAPWCYTDATPIGVALRILHALNYGVPSNWQAISGGGGKPSYPYEPHLLEQVDLGGWVSGEGREEWEIEQQAMVAYAYSRR